MDYYNIAFLIGRILFGGFMLKNAWNHFANSAALTGYAQSKGVPSPKLAVLGAGVLLLAGGLGVLLGVYVQYAVGALILFFVPVTFMMHNFWADTDPNTKMSNQINFWKNLALLGGALMLLAIPEPWMYSLAL